MINLIINLKNIGIQRVIRNTQLNAILLILKSILTMIYVKTSPFMLCIR